MRVDAILLANGVKDPNPLTSGYNVETHSVLEVQAAVSTLVKDLLARSKQRGREPGPNFPKFAILVRFHAK